MIQDPYEFGGSLKQIRRTQKRFVACFAAHNPVLDIGCGRGVFLQMLREAGIVGVGIDSYGPAIEACRQQGLDAEIADALEYVSSSQSTFGGIFCSHVIEHLSFEAATQLVRGCACSLKPDGVLAIVTPNSRDFGVMGETFWLDPTHVRPYPVTLLKSMVSASGLTVLDSGVYHGGLPKREWPKAIGYRLLLGPFHGRPNAFVVARKSA